MNTLFTDGFEGYFDQHKQRDKISTTPFARAPQLDNADYVQLIGNINDVEKYTEIQSSRQIELQQFYNQWMLELEQGFNILFYGVGSKIELINEFLTKWDPDLPVIVANGFNPATTFKDILNLLVDQIVEKELSANWLKLPHERLVLFTEYLTTTNKSVVLVVNSLDGTALRNVKTQSFIARLVESGHVKLLATVDHVNAPLLWSQETLTKLNFVWHHTPTYKPYVTETAYTNILSLGQSHASVGIHAVKTVLGSLTANAQSMYKLLVVLQYEKMASMGITDPNTVGLAAHGTDLTEFYKLCVSKFVVSNEVNFKVMLTEFKEHKMVQVHQRDSTEIAFVPYSFDDLEQMIGDFD